MGYVPAYLGYYPYYGTVVYGTGYHYHPWRGHRYCARPWTWGFHARYNPWLGRWSFGYTYWSRYMRAGYRWRRGPHFGDHPHRPRWFGSGGYHRPQVGADLSMLRTRRARRVPLGDAPMNLYRRPSNAHRIDRGASRLPLQPIAKPARKVVRPNNVFAGQDGKVYQRDARGSWKVNDGHVWKPTQIPRKPPATKEPTPPVGSGKAVGSSSPKAVPLPSQPSATPKPGKARTEPVPAPVVVQPAPPAKPSPAKAQPTVVPVPARPAPVIRAEPGNLEREFRARQRSETPSRSSTTQPAAKPKAEPKSKEEPKAKPAPKEKEKSKTKGKS